MPAQVWICKTCRMIHDSEALATSCEVAHPTLENLQLTGVTYIPVPDHGWGCGGRTKKTPETIRVKFGEWPNEFATYKLERIGPKGV